MELHKKGNILLKWDIFYDRISIKLIEYMKYKGDGNFVNEKMPCNCTSYFSI